MPTYSQTRFPNDVIQTVRTMIAARFNETPLPPRIDPGGYGAGDKAWEGDYPNSKQDDGQYASIELKKWDNSYVLELSDFGFTVPTNATILGIEVEFEAHASLSGKIINQALRISVGTESKGNENEFWPASDTVYVRGAANDLWGAANVYPGDVNAQGFTVYFECENYEYNGTVWGYVDYVKAIVHYSTP